MKAEKTESPGSRPSTRNRVLFAAGLLAIGAAIIAGLSVIRAQIGSVDFFYYICTSRDLATGADVPLSRYGYFPGVYAFWGEVIRLGGGSLAGLQWTYLGLLLANVFSVAWLVGRVGRSAGAGALAALWCAAGYTSCEGFAGCTEPLATLPLLLALLVWRGAPLRGWRGLVSALALGLGMGLATYAKQPGGLLALGWLAMFPTLLAPAELRHRLHYLLTIPVVAALTFVGGLLLEGHGFEPLRLGLRSVGMYEVLEPGWLVVIVGACIFVMTLALMLMPGFSKYRAQPWHGLAGFCAAAAAAACFQFTKRSYLHYHLIAVPFIIVAMSVVLAQMTSEIRRSVRWNPGIRIALLALAIVLPTFDVWLTAPPPLWPSDPQTLADLAALRRVVRPGDELIPLPSYRNELHFHLGTRLYTAPFGYGWSLRPDYVPSLLHMPQLNAALVVTRDVHDWESRTGINFNAASAELHKNGFHKAVELPTMTLWRR